MRIICLNRMVPFAASNAHICSRELLNNCLSTNQDLSRYLGPIIVVTGPTGAGKSGLAVALCEQFGGEVVNADSMQVYSDLPAHRRLSL